MLFKKEFLVELARDDYDEEEVLSIYNKLIDTSRWSEIYEQVFLFNGKYYKTSYSVGATECQDERPYEYEGDEIACIEVIPKEVTSIIYVPIDK